MAHRTSLSRKDSVAFAVDPGAENSVLTLGLRTLCFEDSSWTMRSASEAPADAYAACWGSAKTTQQVS